MDDSAYIIVMASEDNEEFQVFATNKFEMMSVCKKALSSDQFIVSVNAIPNILTAKDYLDTDESDINYGSDKGE